MMKVFTKINNMTGKMGLIIKKNAPEYLLGAGVVGFIGTVVLACKATTSAEEVLDRHREKIDEIKKAVDILNNPNIEKKPEDELFDPNRAKVVVYANTIKDFGKLYAPTIAAGSLTLACFFKSYNIMKTRYLGVVAAYNLVSSAFEDYRNNVREELGEEADRRFRYGIHEADVTTIDDNGKNKNKKEVVKTVEIDGPSQYAVVFDKNCAEWDSNNIYNLKWLRANETAANDILNTRGHIFLNEVYDMIGLPHTKAGAVVGWIKGQGDGYVDFGLYDPDNESHIRYVNGDESNILLDFNVDGIIFDKI